LAVIVHPSNPQGQISKENVARIYLGKTSLFPSGGAVVAADQVSGSPARSYFYDNVIEKPESRMKVYWARLMFTGKGRPPKLVGDDYAVRAYVAENRTAIGYVSRESVDNSVKVILIIP
jgi:ABC-type phosphate transport system substrate-binding protein